MLNSSLFVELGEAIGNIKRRLFPHRTHSDEPDAAFRRHLQEPLPVRLTDINEEIHKPGDVVIEGEFRVIE